MTGAMPQQMTASYPYWDVCVEHLKRVNMARWVAHFVKTVTTG